MIHAKVFVTLKNGVSDPQGAAIGQSLKTMGFSGISNVRQGKVIEIQLENGDEAYARAQLDAMCRQLLANTVIEDYEIEIAS